MSQGTLRGTVNIARNCPIGIPNSRRGKAVKCSYIGSCSFEGGTGVRFRAGMGNRRENDSPFRLYDCTFAAFRGCFAQPGSGAVSPDWLQELDANKLNVTRLLATLNLGLNRGHPVGNQG